MAQVLGPVLKPCSSLIDSKTCKHLILPLWLVLLHRRPLDRWQLLELLSSLPLSGCETSLWLILGGDVSAVWKWNLFSHAAAGGVDVGGIFRTWRTESDVRHLHFVNLKQCLYFVPYTTNFVPLFACAHEVWSFFFFLACSCKCKRAVVHYSNVVFGQAVSQHLFSSDYSCLRRKHWSTADSCMLLPSELTQNTYNTCSHIYNCLTDTWLINRH